MKQWAWGVLIVGAVCAMSEVACADFEKLSEPASVPTDVEDWKGYYFYQDPLPEQDLLPSQLPPTPAIPLQPEHFKDQVALKEALKKVPVEKIDLPSLPAAWLKLLLTAKKEAALDVQTEDTLLSYIKVHKETFNRAQRFTDMWALVMYTHPENDFTSTNPISTAGHDIYSVVKKDSEDDYLKGMKDKAGLFFFFSSTCPYCQKQAQLLKVFSDSYGIAVKAVTQDGRALPEFPEAVVDNGMGEQLGVNKVPVIFLAIPDEHFIVPVGTGLITLDDLRQRVLAILKHRSSLKSHPLKS
jgi:conjugal transfer pilus assembly protein TraF